jgi:excisionase family DNA binding protein
MADELDLLSGAEAIATYIGVKPRRIYHLAETRRLPVFRIGSTLCARRSTLLRWIEDMERAAITSAGHPLDSK